MADGVTQADRAADGTVLLVANYESDVGYAWWLMENFWRVIADAVARQGRRCLLAYPRVAGIPEIIQQAPLEIVECAIRRNTWKEVWSGLRMIRRQRVRSIYVSDWPNTHWIYLLWRLAGVKSIVLHMHSGGDRPPTVGVRALLKDAVHAFGLMSATLYVAPSPYMGRRLLEVGRVPPTRCAVVTNGIRLFERSPDRQAEVRARIDVPNDAVLVVMVSRATYAKGLDFAVRCLSELVNSPAPGACVYAVHCGDGPDLEAFAQMAAEAGLGARFRFLGRRSDVRDILGAADIALHPSKSEAMSLAILEFLCAGLAVVTPDLPSVSSAIEPGVTGLTYKNANLTDAVATLRRLVADATLRQSLGGAAAASCRTSYSLDTMNQAFAEKVIPAI